ncbi:hypothetical protein, partial [Mycobacterium tuberculosis]
DAVEDVLGVGQKVQVELKEIDPRGKLSLAAVVAGGDAAPEAAPESQQAQPAAQSEPTDEAPAGDAGQPSRADDAEAPEV